MERSGMGIHVYLTPKVTTFPTLNTLGFLSFSTGSS